jgi:hypothetical protein
MFTGFKSESGKTFNEVGISVDLQVIYDKVLRYNKLST